MAAAPQKDAKGKPESKPLTAKAKAARLREIDDKLAELQVIIDRSDEEWLAIAQDTMQRVFSGWPVAASWLKEVPAAARKHFIARSPIGRRRHLDAYLHPDEAVRAGMDRRGPNAIIQGFASEIGCVAAHTVGEYVWTTFVRHGLPLDLRLVNLVHDSQASVVDDHLLPIALYAIEHGMTTMTQDFYRKHFKLEFDSPLAFDIEFGQREDEMIKWSDLRFDTLETLLREAYKDHPKAVLKALIHNMKVVQRLREKELRTDQFKMRPEALDPEFWRKNIIWTVEEKRASNVIRLPARKERRKGLPTVTIGGRSVTIGQRRAA